MSVLLRIVVATAVFIGSAVAASAPSDRDVALSVLRKAVPDAHWAASEQVVGDVNCDGRSDLSYLGEETDHFLVATVLAPISATSKFSVVRLPMSGDSQDAVNNPTPKLMKESMDYNTKDELGGNPEGFMQSKQCIGLVIPLEDTDPFHFYWNRKAMRLDWWRS